MSRSSKALLLVVAAGLAAAWLASCNSGSPTKPATAGGGGVGGTASELGGSLRASGGSSGIYGSTCSALSVSRDTVHVGDTVTRTNNSPLSYNVVSL
jgi:hypothetical protein